MKMFPERRLERIQKRLQKDAQRLQKTQQALRAQQAAVDTFHQVQKSTDALVEGMPFSQPAAKQFLKGFLDGYISKVIETDFNPPKPSFLSKIKLPRIFKKKEEANILTLMNQDSNIN